MVRNMIRNLKDGNPSSCSRVSGGSHRFEKYFSPLRVTNEIHSGDEGKKDDTEQELASDLECQAESDKMGRPTKTASSRDEGNDQDDYTAQALSDDARRREHWIMEL